MSPHDESVAPEHPLPAVSMIIPLAEVASPDLEFRISLETPRGVVTEYAVSGLDAGDSISLILSANESRKRWPPSVRRIP
jgi:hypothetical protein